MSESIKNYGTHQNHTHPDPNPIEETTNNHSSQSSSSSSSSTSSTTYFQTPTTITSPQPNTRKEQDLKFTSLLQTLTNRDLTLITLGFLSLLLSLYALLHVTHNTSSTSRFQNLHKGYINDVGDKGLFLPFPKITRNTYNSNTLTSNIAYPSIGNLDLSILSEENHVPLPTGSFYTNLLLKPSNLNADTNPILVDPYSVKINLSTSNGGVDGGIKIGYGRGRKESSDGLIVSLDVINDLSFSMFTPKLDGVDETETKSLKLKVDGIKGGGGMGVNVQLSKPQPSPPSASNIRGNGKRIESVWSPLVRGSPYITLIYSRGTVSSVTAIDYFEAVCSTPFSSLNNDEEMCISSDNEIYGKRFTAKLSDGMEWVLFTSQNVTLKTAKTEGSLKTLLITPTNTNSEMVIRTAVIPILPVMISTNTSINTRKNDVNDVKAREDIIGTLTKYSNVFPTGCQVSSSFDVNVNPNGINNVDGNVDGNNNGRRRNWKKDEIAFNWFWDTLFSYNAHAHTADEGGSNDNKKEEEEEEELLLMLALPHHVDTLLPIPILNPSSQSSSRPHRDLELILITSLYTNNTYHTIKGNLKPIVGNKWQMLERFLPEIDLLGLPLTSHEHSLENSHENVYKWYRSNDKLRKFLLKRAVLDVKNTPIPFTRDVYGFGKQLSRLCNLALILHELAIQTDADAAELAVLKSVVDRIDTELILWFSGKNEDRLLYDESIGGIVTLDGVKDKAKDYGNGWYNDHHFHYGYLLYSSSALVYLQKSTSTHGHYSHHHHPSSSFLDKFKNHVSVLSMDICNPSSQSTQFPLSRHKDFYSSHSWASGLFPQGNGKSQESTSEAVNAYNACSLWGFISGDKMAGDFGRLLAATEIKGAQKYWQMSSSDSDSDDDDGSEVYSKEFRKNGMAGNVGAFDVTAKTWFGTNPEYVHGINIMPLTSITPRLLSKSYLKSEWSKTNKDSINVRIENGEINDEWLSVLLGSMSLVDPVKAWNITIDRFVHVNGVVDSGLSVSWLLRFIALRAFEVGGDEMVEGLVFEYTDTDTDDGSGRSGDSKGGEGGGGGAAAADCENHEECKGLTGMCCPTTDGTFLGCC